MTQVCDDVTEIQCDIVPYTECEMGMQSTPYKSCVPVPKNFTVKDCDETPEVRHHKKMMPECRNVTKQNCVTKWETDSYGKQVRKNFHCSKIYNTVLNNVLLVSRRPSFNSIKSADSFGIILSMERHATILQRWIDFFSHCLHDGSLWHVTYVSYEYLIIERP